MKTILSMALVLGFAIIPLVVAYAEGDRPSAKAAVLRGRVSDEAGAPLADVRVRVAIPATDMRFIGVGRGIVQGAEARYELMETRTDAGGAYRVEIPRVTRPTKVALDAMKPGYRRLVGTLMSGGDPNEVEIKPGAEVELSIKLKVSAYFRGVVVDEKGTPIPKLNVGAQASYDRMSGGIEQTTTNPDGSFEIFSYPEKLTDLGQGPGRGLVFFNHPDYILNRLDDIYSLAPKDREAIRVVMRTGYKVTGTVLGRTGRPVPGAMVTVSKDGGQMKGIRADGSGKFTLRGLREGPAVLSVRNMEIKQKAELPLTLKGDELDVVIRLKPLVVPGGVKSYPVLGMQLADVTPELKSAYGLRYDRGAMILDPGPHSERLKIGEIAESDVFWMVGDQRVGSVRELVDQLLVEPGVQIAGERGIRVVYGFIRVDAGGNNTQYIRFTEDERRQLQGLSEQLRARSE